MSRRPRHPGLHDARGNEIPHRLLDVRGVPTFLYDSGEGSGEAAPPIVLIHGYGDSADGWRRVVPGLLPRHRVIAVDVPPFGRSAEPPDTPRLLDFYKQFFPELFERLEIGSATVIGHSLGGATALHVALERPGLIDRLGLVAPAGLGKAPPWWWHLLAGHGLLWHHALAIPSPLSPLLIRQGMKRFLDWRLFHDPSRLEQDIRHLVDMHGTRADLDRLLKAGRCCIDSYTGRLLEDSRALEMPIWLAWGRRDGLVPSEHALAFARAHPDAAVHVFEDCGHYPHIELPHRFNRLLREWMAATAPGPRLRRVA
jgi:pimeloyl-ACP methyl ester carboxylesterase